MPNQKKYYTYNGREYEDYYYNLEKRKEEETRKSFAALDVCKYCEMPKSADSCCTEPPYCDGPAYCPRCRVFKDASYLEDLYWEKRLEVKKEISVETSEKVSPVSKRKLRF